MTNRTRNEVLEDIWYTIGGGPGGARISTMFGEVSTAPLTPVIQISAQYGNEDDLNIVESNGGTHTLEQSLYKVNSDSPNPA